MNKKFYFGLALTAGLFASCSSDDLVGESASSQAFIDNGAPAKIEIGLTPGYEITRGTGIVGNTSTATDASRNQWAGQKFHVLMLEKGTMLGARTTPDDETTAIFKGAPFTATGVGVQALDNDAVFYPTLKQDGTSVGVYDFWGYRLDGSEVLDANNKVQFIGYDAAATDASYTWGTAQTDAPTGVAPGDIAELTAAPSSTTVGVKDKWYKYTDDQGTPETDDDVLKYVQCTAATAAAGNQITIPFEINGTQDVMVAATSASDQTYADANPSLIFSAKSARNGVKPNLAFKHLLTSLTFKVKPKSRDITDQADNPTSDPRFVPGYEITNITLKSMATGELIVAYTDATEPERITWGAGQDWADPAHLTAFQLQCRKKQVQDAADIKMVKIATATSASGPLAYTASYIDMNGGSSYTIPTGGAPDDLEVYDAEGTNDDTGLPLGNKTTIKALRDAGEDYGWILTYNSTDRTSATPKKYNCEYKGTAEAVTTDLVPYLTNNGMYKYVLAWNAPSTPATYKNTTTISADEYDALPPQNKGGDVADAAALDLLKTKENLHKAYHNLDDGKYYVIELLSPAAWTDDAAKTPEVIGEPMLVAPSNDAANSGYQATVTYKYYQKKDVKTVEERTKTTDPFIINNYIKDGGNKVKGPFLAGKNYNITITLYSDGEAVTGEATSEPWGTGGDLDANDD